MHTYIRTSPLARIDPGHSGFLGSRGGMYSSSAFSTYMGPAAVTSYPPDLNILLVFQSLLICSRMHMHKALSYCVYIWDGVT